MAVSRVQFNSPVSDLLRNVFRFIFMKNQATKVIDRVQCVKWLIAVDVGLDIADKFPDINALSLKGYFAGVAEFISEAFLFVGGLSADWIETAPIADDGLQLCFNVADRRVIWESLDEVTQDGGALCKLSTV